MAGDGIACMLMRGGTSKGPFFLASDLPADAAARDDLLLRIMGSPDPSQIDGIGGATPLTSKVAIVSPSREPGIDLDYLFAQVSVDDARVSTTQTCGNLLAAVGPFAIERGLVAAHAPVTTLRIRLVNTGDIATARVQTPGGAVTYDGDTEIAGVPGTAAPIELELAGGGPLLPSGDVRDEVAGVEATLVDNGMPVVLLRAGDLGVGGDESPAELEADAALGATLERIRLAAGERMGLGEVREQTVPKLILLSPPRSGGAIATRAFIPTRVHTSIGVLMAASVAAGVRLAGAVGNELATDPGEPGDPAPVLVEHPAGTFASRVTVSRGADGAWRGTSVSIRTARKLFDGRVFARTGR